MPEGEEWGVDFGGAERRNIRGSWGIDTKGPPREGEGEESYLEI